MRNPIPVHDAVEEFLCFMRARNDSPHTLRSYNRELLLLARFVGQDLAIAELNRKLIRRYLFSVDPGRIGPQSLRNKIAILRSFSTWLVNESYVEISPTEGIVGPRASRKLPDVPSETDMALLIDGEIPTACPDRDRVILELLYSCGLRASEVAGVNVSDFKGDRTLLVRGKGKKERLVPVGRKAREAVEASLPGGPGC